MEDPVKVLFLCHGNICRSTMAEFVMADKVERAGLTGSIYVQSAALRRDEIGSDTHPGTKEALRAHGIPFQPRAARLVTAEDYEEFDYIIGMDRYNMADMLQRFKRDPQNKCSLLLDWPAWNRDVDDPWYTGDFEATFDDVDAGCTALLETLIRSHRLK